MTKLRAGIIGLSDVITSAKADAAPHPVLGTKMPYTHAAAYEISPTTELVAICDIVQPPLDRFKDRWGARWPDLKYFTDWRAMLAETKLDVLSICTPDDVHADMVVAACEAGIKGIICEKPIATTMKDALRMVETTERYGVKMSIEHTRRWVYDYHEARAQVRAGRIGQLRRIVGTLNGERAMLFRNGTHLIDLICFFAESDPEWVTGALDAEFDGYGPRYAGDGGRLPKFDPGAVGIISFKNGVRALYQGSQGTIGGLYLELIGDKGRIHVGASDHEFTLSTTGDGPYDVVTRNLPRHHTTRGTLQAVIEEMAELVVNGGESVSPPREALRSLSIMLGMLQSHHRAGVRVAMPVSDM
ncbi:MAG: Gfo/Idh/MocA family oxidoreductase [Chloroflexi bacterium]|nr:Gfo/Idh/MocA family oxidoreductase [Chloroflexota bacterium]